MIRRVLVTRPEPGASRTAARLEQLGFAPVILPLTRIVPVALETLPPADQFDAFIVTSPNAVRHMPALAYEKPLFAVGGATADAARKVGFRDVRVAAGTAVDLARLIKADLSPGARLLHLAAVQRTEGFDVALREAGFLLEVVEVYSAEQSSYAPGEIRALLAGAGIWGAPILSTRAATLLARLVDANSDLVKGLEQTVFFCISAKAAAPLSRHASSRLMVSAEPSEESVLALLSSQS